MRKSRVRGRPAKKLLLGVVAAACVVGVGASSLSAAGPQFTGWSAPVNLGATVNSGSTEFGPALSKNGLSLYFTSNRPTGSGGLDIWVSQRQARDAAWGTPVNLGASINTAANDFVPAFSRDGHWMFFASTRPGGYGMADVWASWRPQTHNDFGWEAPINLGANVNSAFNDNGVGYFENDDRGAPQLFSGVIAQAALAAPICT
jgi:Tol biopolymer transport system component